MDDRAVRRRRSWVILALVAVGLPILAYLGLMLAIGIGMSSGH